MVVHDQQLLHLVVHHHLLGLANAFPRADLQQRHLHQVPGRNARLPSFEQHARDIGGGERTNNVFFLVHYRENTLPLFRHKLYDLLAFCSGGQSVHVPALFVGFVHKCCFKNIMGIFTVMGLRVHFAGNLAFVDAPLAGHHIRDGTYPHTGEQQFVVAGKLAHHNDGGQWRVGGSGKKAGHPHNGKS